MGFNRVSIPNVSNHEVENQIIEKSGFSVNRVEVNRTAKGIMSPVERGHYVFDNKVIMPIEVTAEILVKEDEWDYVWSELEQMFNNRKYESTRSTPKARS